MSPKIRPFWFYLIPLPLALIALLLGPAEQIGPDRALKELLSLIAGSAPREDSGLVRTILWEVRLPRILLAFLVGASLTASGNALQALFRNPLVSPDILGLSSGAAFGAALALSLGFLPLQTTAFFFGLLAVGLSYFLARSRQGVSILSLILAGIIISGIFTAALTVVQFLTDPFKLQTIVHWTMGNLHNANWEKVRSAFLPVSLGGLGLFLIRWRMNVLALGDEETRAVGSTRSEKRSGSCCPLPWRPRRRRPWPG